MSSGDENIRAFETRDYPVLAEITNSLNPEFPRTAEEIEFHDRKRDEDPREDQPIKWARFVWEDCGKVLAAAHYMQDVWMYHPRKFDIDLRVHPTAQRRGIGAALYEHVRAEVDRHGPIKLSAAVCGNHAGASSFLGKRGFSPGFRSWDSKLDLASWDPAAFSPAVERLLSSGLEIWDLNRLRDELPDWDAQVYGLEEEIIRDMPLPDPHTPLGLSRWRSQVLDSPNFYPEAWRLAMEGDRPVGISNLWRRRIGDGLNTGLTGVLRGHRRRGVALALKVSSLGFAKERGHSEVGTDNEEHNVGMISINKTLGFVDRPSWQRWTLDLEDTDVER